MQLYLVDKILTITGCIKMNKIKFFIKKAQLIRDKTIIPKNRNYLKKARNNLEVLNALDKLNNNKKARELLNLPSDFDASEWIAISGYYAMYTAALALLAKIGFRSKNHTATLLVLEKYFVKKNLLDESTYLTLKNAVFQKQEIDKLAEARHQREIAQYSITKQTTKDIAEKIRQDAYFFVNKCEELLEV